MYACKVSEFSEVSRFVVPLPARDSYAEQRRIENALVFPNSNDSVSDSVFSCLTALGAICLFRQYLEDCSRRDGEMERVTRIRRGEGFASPLRRLRIFHELRKSVPRTMDQAIVVPFTLDSRSIIFLTTLLLLSHSPSSPRPPHADRTSVFRNVDRENLAMRHVYKSLAFHFGIGR